MINPGDQLVNPVTGERLIFHETSQSTKGEYVLVETIVEPGGCVAAAHVHPSQTERFEVVEGKLGMKAGRKKLELGPGESVVVEPGTAHKFWNAGETEVRFVCEIRPAQQFEQLIETMFSLAADGKTNRKGMPKPRQLALFVREFEREVRAPFPPPAIVKALMAPLAAMA